MTAKWDQTTYPAVIEYTKTGINRDLYEKNIILRLDEVKRDIKQFGRGSSSTLQVTSLIEIDVIILDPGGTFNENFALLNDVVNELVDKLKGASSDVETYEVRISADLDDGRYDSRTDTKYMREEGTQPTCGYVYEELYEYSTSRHAILIFDLVDCIDELEGKISETTVNFKIYVNLDFTNNDGGFKIYLIDDDDPSYPDLDPGDVPIVEPGVDWDYTGGTGWQTADISTLVESYINRPTRDETETRMGITIRPNTTSGTVDDVFYFAPYSEEGTTMSKIVIEYPLITVEVLNVFNVSTDRKNEQFKYKLQIRVIYYE